MLKICKWCSWLLLAQQNINLALSVLFLTFITLILLPITAFFIIGAKVCVEINKYINDTQTSKIEAMRYIREGLLGKDEK